MGPRGATSDRAARAALLGGMLPALAGLFFWWAWRQGAYFGTVFYPGAIGAFLLLAVLAAFAPVAIGLRGVPALGAGALAAIGVWTVASMLWTSTQAAAVAYAAHAFLYLALLLVGVGVCRLCGRRPTLALLPVAIAAVAIAVAVVFTLAGGHDLNLYFHGDATLRLPFGYRNANAAFFLVCLWPTLAIVCDRTMPWALRVGMVAGATALVELVILCQSRGSVPAAIVAMGAWLLYSRSRLAAAAYLLVIAVPVVVATPTLLQVFQYGELDRGLLPVMHDAATAIALSALGALVLGAFVVTGLEPRTNPSPRLQRRLGRAVAVTVTGVVVAAVTVFLVHEGGPTKFVDQRVDQFSAGGITDFSRTNARFGVDVGSNRGDFWRVSLDQVGRTPLLGEGAGSFSLTYLLHRHSPESPHDPHSVEMLMLDELGIPGMLLLFTFVGSVLVGAVRSCGAGPGAALAVAAGAAGVVYWSVHASYDWFWNYPALTGTMAFLAGVAIAPGASAVGERLRRGQRAAIVVGAILLSLLAAPLFLSERYVGRGLSEERADPAAAYADFDRAKALNPFDPAPLIDKALLAAGRGERSTAILALREAVGREPANYAPHLLLAQILESGNSAAARREIEIAIRLNPYEEELRNLRKKMRRAAR